MPARSLEDSLSSAEEARTAIERFLKTSHQPVLLEPGEDPFPLAEGQFTVEWRDSRLTVQVWDRTRNLVRRIRAVQKETSGRLELTVEKFAKRTGQVLLMDRARPDHAVLELRGKRLSFREQFRRFLCLQFPDWEISGLSTEPDLEHSLSPVYPRALLTRGASGMAAIGCPRDSGEATGMLSFGLIWLDYLRRTEQRLTLEGLALFVPAGLDRTTSLRLRFLDTRLAQYLAFVYSPEGLVERLDLRDRGNLDTRLDACRSGEVMDGRLEEWIERLCRRPQVERVTNGDGSLSLRVRGLPFARTAAKELVFGLETPSPARESNLREIEQLAAELARLRSPQAPDRENPLYRRRPEGWLESQVRANIETLDASLMPAPVYGQVPAFTGGDRGVLDLLAVDRAGRLAVLELKASEDLHLPLQALDYWMRVKWHLDRGEFSARGYFPGVELVRQPPRLLLVAPSLDFHPTTESILRYFSPDVPVERIGLGVEWRRKLEVMFRIGGARKPG